MNGLINLGNTCYMNSIIQCISHLGFLSDQNIELSEQCIKTVHKNDFELMEQWLKLQKSLRNINKEVGFKETSIIFLIVGDQSEILKRMGGEKPNYVRIINPKFKDMPNIVAIGDICLSLRYINFTFPSKVMVFLRAGKPIIAIDTDAHKQILKQDYNARLIGYRTREIIKEIITLSKHPKKRDKLSKFAKESYENNRQTWW